MVIGKSGAQVQYQSNGILLWTFTAHDLHMTRLDIHT
jgi:hypothetical protein